MNFETQLAHVDQFKKEGFLVTNDAELFSNVIMELGKQKVSFVPDDAGDFKYCIIKA